MTESVTTRYAGTRMPRVEDTRLLTGHGTFVDDIQRPGMLHACFVRSPHAHANIKRIDASKALALEGVKAVITADDFPSPDDSLAEIGIDAALHDIRFVEDCS